MKFTVDGRPVTAEPGQSIAAALLADGQRVLRHTKRTGAARGLFCGIGVCFDCVVVVNGEPNVRACITEVDEGDRVETQEGAGHAGLAC